MKKKFTPRQVTIHGKKQWMVDVSFNPAGGGKRVRERKFYDSKGEAEGRAEWARRTVKKSGIEALYNEELERFGKTPQDAIAFYLDHLRKSKSSVPIEEAIEKLIGAKEQARRSKRYTKGLGNTLKNLAAAFPGKSVGEITTADLSDFLGNLKLESGETVSAGTWNTYRRDIRTLWGFCETRGWAVAKVAKTEKANGDDAPTVILTPEEAEALLTESKDDELLAYHAIALFAGLRPSEIKRLQWGRHVNLATGFIRLDAAITKTKRGRQVPILSNLRAYLEPIAKAPGSKVITGWIDTRAEAARKRTGIAWVEHIMRHSFASYRLAEIQNENQVSLEAGHSVTILREHYLQLVTPEDAKRYFGIRPEESEKIVPIPMVA